MKIDLICSSCFEELQKTISEGGEPPKNRLKYYKVQITNESSYLVECDFGHSSIASITSMNHEILYEFGVNAIIDGYYRESISSFASSLERFYEFAVKSFAVANECSLDEIERCWKDVANQSERQLGAYIFLYAVHFKRKPLILSQKMIELRNSAIHKGVIPTYEKAIEFGEAVLGIIRPAFDEISKSIVIASHTVGGNEAKKSYDKIKPKNKTTVDLFQQIDSLIRQERSLVEHLQITRQRKLV